MVRLKMLQTVWALVNGATQRLEAGSVHEVENDEAARDLVRGRYAVPVEEDVSRETGAETASVEPRRETAVMPRGKAKGLKAS